MQQLKKIAYLFSRLQNFGCIYPIFILYNIKTTLNLNIFYVIWHFFDFFTQKSLEDKNKTATFAPRNTDLPHKVEGRPYTEKLIIHLFIFLITKNMAYLLNQIACLSKEQVNLLNAAGYNTTEEFLTYCCKVTHRRKLSAETGIDDKILLKVTNIADLFRIHGIDEKLVELFRAENINTLRALRNRVPSHLQPILERINKEKHICSHVPTLPELEKIIAEAKSLRPCLTY